jgi:cobalt/nickel transport system permease protein
MRSVEESACLSRLRERTVETCVLCAGLGLCALAIPSPLAGIAVLLASLVVARLSDVPMGGYLRLLLAASGFAVTSILPLSVAIHWHPLALSWDPAGFRVGLLAGTRAVGTLSATLLLVFTTPFPRLLMLLRRLRTPVIVTDLLALVHREIFLLDEGFGKLRRALACRGGWNGIRSGMQCLSLGMAALFVRALEHSRRLEAGLASRGAIEGEVVFWDEASELHPGALAFALVLPTALAVLLLWGRRRLGN